MKKTYINILNKYEQGRITSSGFIIELLNSLNHDELKDALELLPSDLVERVRVFVESYRPEMRVFRGLAPDLDAVEMARELLTRAVRST
jgi:hypothetical protein